MKHKFESLFLLALVMTFLAHEGIGAGELARTTNASSQTGGLPLWEAGLFGVVGRLPHYRGSDEYKLYVLPLPYVIYRGKIVQADRDGVRGVFYKGRWLETEFSLSGNPPVDEGNTARRGMPVLDPLVELGPAAKIFLYRGERSSTLYLEAAVRGVVSVDQDNFGPHYEGKRALLYLAMGTHTPGSPWAAGLRTGVDFADHEYNGYFYDVSEAQVLPDRGSYGSEGGYGGYSLSGFVKREMSRDLSISVYGRWDNVDGAVYESSPLVKTQNNFIFAAAVIWKIGASERRVGNQ